MIDWEDMRAAAWESCKIVLTSVICLVAGFMILVIPIALVSMTGSLWWTLIWVIVIFIGFTISIYIDRRKDERFWMK